MSKTLINDEEVDWVEVDENVRRKVMAHTDRLMLVKVAFKAGGIGSLHQHEHDQISHIDSGVFEIEISGEKRILKAGDAYHVPSNAWHGARCIEEGVLIDAFSPCRNDFIG
jgi:quercetin dioxygenase-like cupin family protein